VILLKLASQEYCLGLATTIQAWGRAVGVGGSAGDSGEVGVVSGADGFACSCAGDWDPTPVFGSRVMSARAGGVVTAYSVALTTTVRLHTVGLSSGGAVIRVALWSRPNRMAAYLQFEGDHLRIAQDQVLPRHWQVAARSVPRSQVTLPVLSRVNSRRKSAPGRIGPPSRLDRETAAIPRPN